MDNNQTQNALSGFLGAIDGLRGLLIDGLNGDKLGSAPTGSIGALGAIVGIDASIDKYNNSEKTAEDFARLALDLATNLPGTSGLIASDFSFTYIINGVRHDIQNFHLKSVGYNFNLHD